MRSEAEIRRASEHVRVGLAMSNGDKVHTARLTALQDALTWVLGIEGTKLGEMVRRAEAAPLPPLAADIVSALLNLGMGTQFRSEEIARQVVRELPDADFETAIRRALTLARPAR